MKTHIILMIMLTGCSFVEFVPFGGDDEASTGAGGESDGEDADDTGSVDVPYEYGPCFDNFSMTRFLCEEMNTALGLSPDYTCSIWTEHGAWPVSHTTTSALELAMPTAMVWWDDGWDADGHGPAWLDLSAWAASVGTDRVHVVVPAENKTVLEMAVESEPQGSVAIGNYAWIATDQCCDGVSLMTPSGPEDSSTLDTNGIRAHIAMHEYGETEEVRWAVPSHCHLGVEVNDESFPMAALSGPDGSAETVLDADGANIGVYGGITAIVASAAGG
jgi:hypothetical protein